MKILVAEDDKNLRAVLTNELSEQGFEVDVAENGTRALDLLENKSAVSFSGPAYCQPSALISQASETGCR